MNVTQMLIATSAAAGDEDAACTLGILGVL